MLAPPGGAHRDKNKAPSFLSISPSLSGAEIDKKRGMVLITAGCTWSTRQ